MYDLAIVGSGPAGVAAAINAKIRGLDFVIFGAEARSRKLESAKIVQNYPGLPGKSGAQIARAFAAHMEEMGVSVTKRAIDRVYAMGDFFTLTSGDEAFESRAVILATGVSPQKMLPGEEERVGRGVSYCATCDGGLYKGKAVTVLAYEPGALREAEYLARFASVTYVPLTEGASAPEGARVVSGILPREIRTEDGRMAVVTDGETLLSDGVFIFRSAVAPSILVPGLETNEGCALVGRDLSASIPGLFAAGDVTGHPHQIAKAVGEGATAALSAAEYLSRRKRADD